jgi:hypothetical protein
MRQKSLYVSENYGRYDSNFLYTEDSISQDATVSAHLDMMHCEYRKL